jgi:hypothetical protein
MIAIAHLPTSVSSSRATPSRLDSSAPDPRSPAAVASGRLSPPAAGSPAAVATPATPRMWPIPHPAYDPGGPVQTLYQNETWGPARLVSVPADVHAGGGNAANGGAPELVRALPDRQIPERPSMTVRAARHRRGRHRAPRQPLRLAPPPGTGRSVTALASSGLLVAVATTSAAAEPVRDPGPAPRRRARADRGGALLDGPLARRGRRGRRRVAGRPPGRQLRARPTTSAPTAATRTEPDVVARTAARTAGTTSAPAPAPPAAPCPHRPVAPPQEISGSAVVRSPASSSACPTCTGRLAERVRLLRLHPVRLCALRVSLPRTSSAQGSVGVRVSACRGQAR